jgi:MFS family permease
MGLLADRVDRPRLLSAGIAAWSILTVVASRAGGFGELLITRVGFAAAQATQNPICFSLIPELFPKSKTAAMGIYNTAIYAGRALSFAAVILAAQLGVPQMSVLGEHLTIGYTLVPLDKVDLTLVSVLYTQGDYAAVSPIYSYADPIDDKGGGGDIGGVGAELEEADAFGAWRKLLRWLGPPGLVIAMLTFLTIDEPRNKQGFVGNPLKSSRFFWNSDKNINNGTTGIDAEQGAMVAAAGGGNGAIIAVKTTDTVGESIAKLRILLSTPAFLALTLAATFNDVGSWALVAWQATFYQRVYDLQPDTYAPLLAVVIPVGGIIGGVGAGVLGDWLFRIGARGWLTAGACLGAAPFIAISLLAPDYKQSFAALLVGFALSEAWRAPAAVMVRDVSPPGLGSAASAAHLCIRNLIGGLGPIAVALLSGKLGLQLAMLLVPVCYMISGVGFLVFESAMAMEKSKQQELLE